jgi:SAM-dependent methyltransferase
MTKMSQALTKLLPRRASSPDSGAVDPCWGDPFSTLRGKWSEVPAADWRIQVSLLHELGDEELLQTWEAMRADAVAGAHFSRRGWYHLLYTPLVRGSRVIDFGCGLGFDGLTFAAEADEVTLVDIVPANLDLLRRLVRLKGLKNVEFLLLESFRSLERLPESCDVVLASGSLHHAPMKVVRCEVQALARILRINGRWLQLAYPKQRWKREGKLPFSQWGKVTDGEGTPWAEWYDADKLLALLQPFHFDVVLAFQYHDADFIWFDLVRRN